MHDLFIHYEDDALLIVEKPAGIPCLPGEISPCLADQLPAAQKELPDFGLVHRLDNETSGLLVIVKNKGTYEILRRQFAEGLIEKEYVAFVVGHPPKQGVIETPISHHPRKKKKMVVSPEGRPAHTEYEVLEHHGPNSFVSVHISTGVRHQIRVHLASIGHPIVGDKVYGKASVDSSRHFLHAHAIAFHHPLTGEDMEFTSPLPADFEEVLESDADC
ncbi:MAG: RluA family pseudouridine synthase [Deltaproteobacteria bacterium]|nr:RluA family pseudouridine synthase [Deltaproteobacteria bacterium]